MQAGCPSTQAQVVSGEDLPHLPCSCGSCLSRLGGLERTSCSKTFRWHHCLATSQRSGGKCSHSIQFDELVISTFSDHFVGGGVCGESFKETHDSAVVWHIALFCPAERLCTAGAVASVSSKEMSKPMFSAHRSSCSAAFCSSFSCGVPGSILLQRLLTINSRRNLLHHRREFCCQVLGGCVCRCQEVNCKCTSLLL